MRFINSEGEEKCSAFALRRYAAERNEVAAGCAANGGRNETDRGWSNGKPHPVGLS